MLNAVCVHMQERQQLSLLERERQAAVRQHEDELAAEMQRLDDVAKEQRLNQMQAMERAYQTQLQVAPPAPSETPPEHFTSRSLHPAPHCQPRLQAHGLAPLPCLHAAAPGILALLQSRALRSSALAKSPK